MRPSPCLADTSFVDDRPPTHFFVKKKFSPTGGAEGATQKVSSGFCHVHTLCKEGLGDTLGIPLPSASLLALPRRFVRSGIQGGKRFLRRTEFAQESPCGAESVLHAGWSFFLYEKSVLRESDSLRGRRKEVCTDLPPL